MITLTVISFNGAPASAPLVGRFDELGGAIGRADTNQLVLPDPDRAISRVHAQIAFRNGRYAIIDRGSNPIAVNGERLGSGAERLLNHGDEVQIGGYLLRAQLQAARPAAPSADPFADLLGPAAAPAHPAQSASWDPLAARPAAPPAPPSASAKPAAAGGIPDDWDPFAAPAAPAPGARGGSFGGKPADSLGLDLGAAGPGPLIPGLPTAASASAGADSLDALFGLKPGGGSSDPLGGSLLDDAAAKPNMAAHADPMRALLSAPKASADTLPDDFSDLHRPFPQATPPARPAAPAAAPPIAPPVALPIAPPIAPLAERAAAAPAPIPESPVPPAAPGGAVLSWDTQGEGRTLIRPVARTAEPAAAAPAVAAPPAPPIPAVDPDPIPPTRPAALPDDPFAGLGLPPAAASAPLAPAPITPMAVAAPPAPQQPLPPPAAATAPAAAASHPAELASLLAALREGLAMPELALDGLTPELMKLIGQLVREAASGTVDLLVARALLKREVRAEATMIVARENNPLKFSPSAEAALQHLLAPPVRGFMAAAPAMRDAYNDLRAHQFGFLAGMRAALEGVLARFDPAELEGRLTQRSVLHSLLPGSRKAAMWEVFTEHYDQIRAEAEDDFHSLFGRAFLEAYEAHIDQLDRGSKP